MFGRWFSAIFLLAIAISAHAEIALLDDTNSIIRLATPARRIISLSPHITELLFAAGAGDHIVGAVEYSDYPEAARSLPRVGSAAALDLERIASLKPDLVVAWGSGNPPRQIDAIRQLNIPVFVSEPKQLADIANTLRRLGKLAGSDARAMDAARNFDQRLAALRARYERRPPVSVFYEVWNQPMMTVGGHHIISSIIRLCGGNNVFDASTQLAPSLDIEAVLRANPEVIIASGMDRNRPEWLDAWRAWPQLRATAAGNLYMVPPDLLQRHTPRILDGAQQVCEALETARQKRQAGR